jgi:hypothetical protein
MHAPPRADGTIHAKQSTMRLSTLAMLVRRVVTAGVIAGGVACAAACSFFVPDTKTPRDRARELEPKCRGGEGDEAAAWLSPAAIDSVEPAYSYVPGGPNGREARLSGAQLHLRPLRGVSRESLTRVLECHQARAILAPVTMRPSDPYVLADRWLSIDVDSARDGFAVVVGSKDLGDARRVLERARAFAGPRDQSASASPPASAAPGGQAAPLQ